MALTESKILAAVSLNIAANTIEVRWDNIITRDDEQISRVPHRCAYGFDQKDAFLAEVEGAQSYAAAMGW